MPDELRRLACRALGVVGTVFVLFILIGFCLGWCARRLAGQDIPRVTQTWKCRVEPGKPTDDAKTSYYARGWLEVDTDGKVDILHKQLVAVRPTRRKALHDCADYLADHADETERAEKKD